MWVPRDLLDQAEEDNLGDLVGDDAGIGGPSVDPLSADDADAKDDNLGSETEEGEEEI